MKTRERKRRGEGDGDSERNENEKAPKPAAKPKKGRTTLSAMTEEPEQDPAPKSLKKTTKAKGKKTAPENDSVKTRITPNTKIDSEPGPSKIHKKVPVSRNPTSLNRPNMAERRAFQSLGNMACFEKTRLIYGQGSCRRIISPNKIHSQYSTPMAAYFRNFRVNKAEGPSNERLDALEWHPSDPRFVAVGTKWGGMVLWDVTQDLDRDNHVIAGEGPGRQIAEVRFDPSDNDYVYAAKMDGWIEKYNIETKQKTNVEHLEIDCRAEDWKRWWVTVDVCSIGGIIMAGDNLGGVVATHTDGQEKIFGLKLHKGKKIHRIEFSHKEPWLFSTASCDHTVKLWDIRAIRQDPKRKIPQHLCSLDHSYAVNIGTFSRSGSNRLLTSDQYDECQVFQGPMWQRISTWKHPHRQFQHLVPIRVNTASNTHREGRPEASWHPLFDAAVIGRYPNPGKDQENNLIPTEPRSVDIFDGSNGKVLAQLVSKPHNKIASICKFNSTGDTLACTSAQSLIIWKWTNSTEIRSGDDLQQLTVPTQQPIRVTKVKAKMKAKLNS